MPLFGVRYLDFHRAALTGDDRVPYEDWHKTDDAFDTFEEAKSHAESMQKYHSREAWDAETQSYVYRNPTYRFLAYQLPAEMDYVSREDAKIAAGEYTLLPDHMLDKMTGSRRRRYHYPRITNGAMISFYETESMARLDRLTEMKATRYITRYLTASDEDGEDKMWDYMAELGLASNAVFLGFATSREDIRFIYENGPESCMSGKAGQYHNDKVHPAEAYASPDLGVAYLLRGGEDMRADGVEIVGRALCNMNDKSWVRLYGEHKRMEKLLEAEGFQEDPSCLGGCRLLKLFGCRHDGSPNRRIIMLPYLDGLATQVKMVPGDKQFLHIQEQEIYLSGGTRGYWEY